NQTCKRYYQHCFFQNDHLSTFIKLMFNMNRRQLNMKLKKSQKLLFIGDSVTDCERAKPHGEGLFQALGNGYVSIIDSFLQSTYPELGIRVVNKGLSGNTVRDLKARWQEDVLDQSPDWLAIMIGINDVWRQF